MKLPKFPRLKLSYVAFSLTFVILSTHHFLKDDSIEISYSSEQERILSFQFNNIIDQVEWNRLQAINSLPVLNANISDVNSTHIPAAGNLTLEHFSSYEDFLLGQIRRLNSEQLVHNLDRFDLRDDSDGTVVIIVQVHNRSEYLQHLISSLRRADSIDKALLIFSHDFFSVEINSVVATVDFCPVLQIFFPYSQQLHPREFPGEDPRDCPRDVNTEQAKQMKCLNADFPDKYGHYREATFAQIKHHWFWKMNHVFDHLSITKYFNGLVLTLEDDHYVTPDFLPVLRQMYRIRKRVCESCIIFTLGTYDKSPSYDLSTKVDVLTWQSNKHNMGMAFDRSGWNQVKSCGELFCKFDDYNWDWSLNFIGSTCMASKLRAIAVKSPRVFHLGECGGVHSKKTASCSAVSSKVADIESLLETHKTNLFPQSMSVAGYPYTPDRGVKPNGGWGDHRDQDLCIRLMTNSTH